MADISDSENLPIVLLSKVRVSLMTGTLGTNQSRDVDAPTLAKRWNTPNDKSANTMRMTTQCGLRDVTNSMKSSRYPTNNYMLQYTRFPHDLFLGTLIAGSVVYCENICTQVFYTFY